MDMSLILEALLPSLDKSIANSRRLDETTCNDLCQHPGCWASVRRQQKGLARPISPVDTNSDDSDSDLDLPKQSVCNLLGDFGESPTDRYPLSTGGRPSHQWESNSRATTRSSRSVDSFQKLKVPHNTKGSLYSKSTAAGLVRRPRINLVEVQEVFDKTDLNSQWDETFVTKQYYMWVPNPRKPPSLEIQEGSKQKIKRLRREEIRLTHSRWTYKSIPLLTKDLTECMVPAEIEQKREDTIMFDEWPVLKKKQHRNQSPPPRAVQFKKAPMAPIVPPESDLDTEGINELLALPKDALMKVLEHTKKSDFSSKGKLHSILQEYVQYDERARMALSTRELFQPRKMAILKQPNPSEKVEQSRTPIFHLDNEMILDRMSTVNSPIKDKDSISDDHSVDSYLRYKKPLPKIQGQAALDAQETPLVDSSSSMPMLNRKARMPKIPAISLGLPELPSGVKTTRAFSYNKKSLVDFSLGPVISPPSTVRSSYSGEYSDHGTTVKVNAPSSAVGFNGEERMGDYAIHSVSPALSTHVPHPPAVTPATHMSPTKSAPVFRDYKDLSREPTIISVSQKALPPSRDVRETTLLSSMPSNISQRQTLSPMDTRVIGTPDELALDTINETAREVVDGSMTSSQRAVGEVTEPNSARKEEVTALTLEPSALTSINANASPLPKSARSIESCPSPEQWPLISESSFENRVARPSVSEPALSARNRHLPPRGLDDDSSSDREYARKVLDEKISAESPAPPPPSPEPKDRDYRPSRKELLSRDSLSMAPLFEVSEVEEGSPIKEHAGDNDKTLRKDGERRLKQVRQIHAVIPQAKVEQDKKEESEDNDDVMVSQITVTHVTPKGPDPTGKKSEKVQETFLNVDIPAEEISSLKAEHGSSHQEDISSNNTVVQSETTATESEVSVPTAGQQTDRKEEEVKLETVNDVPNDKEMGDTLQDYAALLSEEEKTFTFDDDGQPIENSARDQSEDSVISPELMCDSARFLNHEMVSPVEGEMEDDGVSRMLHLLTEMNAEEEDSEMREGLTGRSFTIDTSRENGNTMTIDGTTEFMGEGKSFTIDTSRENENTMTIDGTTEFMGEGKSFTIDTSRENENTMTIDGTTEFMDEGKSFTIDTSREIENTMNTEGTTEFMGEKKDEEKDELKEQSAVDMKNVESESGAEEKTMVGDGEEATAPGSFFFRTSSSDSSPQDETGPSDKTPRDEYHAEAHVQDTGNVEGEKMANDGLGGDTPKEDHSKTEGGEAESIAAEEKALEEEKTNGKENDAGVKRQDLIDEGINAGENIKVTADAVLNEDNNVNNNVSISETNSNLDGNNKEDGITNVEETSTEDEEIKVIVEDGKVEAIADLNDTPKVDEPSKPDDVGADSAADSSQDAKFDAVDEKQQQGDDCTDAMPQEASGVQVESEGNVENNENGADVLETRMEPEGSDVM